MEISKIVASDLDSTQWNAIQAARAAAVEEAKAAGKPSKAAAIYRKRAAAITNKTETVTVEANK